MTINGNVSGTVMLAVSAKKWLKTEYHKYRFRVMLSMIVMKNSIFWRDFLMVKGPHMQDLFRITDDLLEALDPLEFSDPVTHIYNPLKYARSAYDEYLERYGRKPKEVLLLGMNPGPWGMVQTGVPFGEISAVRDWMGIKPHGGTPGTGHPKRPIEGFLCKRREVSGKRLWGWAKKNLWDA